MATVLNVKDLEAKLQGKSIIHNIDLKVDSGQIHLVMGPNGAGKSTLGKALMNWPDIEVSGEVTLDKKDISDKEMHERSQMGLFLGHQAPIDIPGLHYVEFVRAAYNAGKPEDEQLDPISFLSIFEAYAFKLGLPDDVTERALNDGFSGGERKKAEVLQMLLLEPKIAILDEIDSGLDLDSLKNVFKVIVEYVSETEMGLIVISHNPNILQYITPTHVHLLRDGTIVESGDSKYAEKIINDGYANT